MELERKENAISIHDLTLKYSEVKRNIRSPLGKRISINGLSGINIDIPVGQNTALIGKNGAGKSTLIKAIGGYLRPEIGHIFVKGKVITLAGVNPGFQRNLSSYWNVKKLGIAYGISKEEIDKFSKEIEDFASIGDAYYRQFGGLSTGMRGKVGFGFITALQPNILLIDETLGVGDIEFRQKASGRLKDFIDRSGTVLISTHSLGLAKSMCSHGIYLEGGEVRMYGEIENVVNKYSRGLTSGG